LISISGETWAASTAAKCSANSESPFPVISRRVHATHLAQCRLSLCKRNVVSAEQNATLRQKQNGRPQGYAQENRRVHRQFCVPEVSIFEAKI
jgi:hypothetical protein